MVSGFLLTALAIGYLLVLFGVAFYGERRSVYPGHARLRPWIYSLALGVYCTTWTFFGAVGTAVRELENGDDGSLDRLQFTTRYSF